MADFDRNLNPIIKPDTSQRLTNIPIGPVKNIPVPSVPMHFSNSDGVSDLSQGEDVFSKLNRLMKEGPSGPQAIGVDFKTLQENQRYKTFNPTIDDQEDFAAYGQSELDKAANGLLKGTNLAATTVAGGFASLGGAATSIFTGRLSDIWDNPIHRALDEWNEKVDNEYLPNYYSRKESEAAWYDTDNWMTTNFLFDKLIKNSGFAVGAMVGGNIANASLLRLGAGIGRAAAAGATVTEASQAFKLFTPLLRNTSRAFSAGKNLEAAAILESQIGSIADLSQKTLKLGQLAKQTSAFAGFNDAARRTAIALYSSGGEAAFEALHTGKEMRESLIQEYIKQNGSEPTGEALKVIESEVAQVGKIAFLGNIALLSATEYAQLPFLLGSTYSTSRRTANSLLGETDDVILREGKYVRASSQASKFKKLSQNITGVGRYFFDPKEGAQEIGQYALSVGTQNYFDKANQSNDANVWTDGFMYGLFGKDESGKGVGALNSKEGIEGGILGAITGGLMQAKGNYLSSRARRTNTDEFISALNNAPTFRDAYKDKLNAVNRGVVLQQEYREAVLQGDRQEANDLKYDMSFNYLSPRIKYGRFDMVMEDIADLRNSSLTEEGLAELKQQGIGNIDDTVNTFQARLDSLEKNAKTINDLYQSINLRYSGVVNENKQKLYPPQVIDKMVYASSKISNYDERIPMLTNTLSLSGIVTSEIMNSISKTGKPEKQLVLKALDQINAMDTTSEVKDELKVTLQDSIEMGMRRKMFMTEYDAIKANPLNYERIENADEVTEVEVSQKGNETGESKIKLEVGKSYSLSEPVRLENGKIILAPKIKINATTLSGEYEVGLPDGTVSFLSPEQFEKYNITEKENQNQEYEDLLNQAVDDVFNYTANKDLEKPTGNKLEYVNNLDDPKITTAVYNRFNKLAEDLLKAKAEKQRLERELAKNQEAIKKQQAELQKNSGDVPSIPTPENQRVDTGETGLLKDAEDFFVSTITESEEYNDPTQSSPHITRSRVFLNNAHTFKNRDDLRTIPFTFNQEGSLGLSGITRLSYNVPEDKFNTPEFQSKVTDVNSGFVGAVFVEKASNGKLYFVNQEGKRIGEVGKPVDISQVIFQTMPTTAIADSKGNDRYRSGQKDEFIAYSKAWEKRRQSLFTSPGIQNYQFRISRGVANTERDANKNFVRNNVSILVPDKTISGYEGLLKVSTLGTISHHGKNISVPTGLTVLQHEDVFEILSNNKFGKNKADAIFQVINSLVGEMMVQSGKGATVTLNPAYMSYLQNVLFYKEPVGVAAGNQFWINKDSITIGASTYPFSEIANRETEIVNQLRDTYHSINNKTLTNRFNEEFYEYTFDGSKLKTKKWKNYQTYLLSGKDRGVSETPLVTNVAKPTDAIPYTHAGKYATLINMNLDVVITKQPVVQTPPPPKPKTPPVDPPKTDTKTVKVGNYSINDDSVNEYVFKAGNVDFKAEQTAEGAISVTIVESEKTKATIAKIAQNKPVVDAAKSLVTDPSSLTDEELAAVFVATKISKELTDLYNSTVSKKAEKAPEPPQAPKVETSSIESQKADIERRKQEELKKYSDKDVIKIEEFEFVDDEGNIVYVQIRHFPNGRRLAYQGIEKNKYGNVNDNSPFDISKEQSTEDYLKAAYPENTFGKYSKTGERTGNEASLDTYSRKINAKYNAELKAIETTETETQAEQQKADIEKRRQDELRQNLSKTDFAISLFPALSQNNMSQGGGAYVEVVFGKNNKFKLDTYLTPSSINGQYSSITDGKAQLHGHMEDGTPISIPWNQLKDLLISIKAVDVTGKIVYEFDTNKINAKYDAEIAALGQTSETKSIDTSKFKRRGDNPVYRRVGVNSSSRITEREIELFKDWHSKNVPNIPYRIMENVLTTHDNKSAWGVFENGVAKFYKGAIKGTEYHEIFEGIWKAFLSSSEQQAILDEFKSQSGDFIDRETGRRIPYNEATDNQARERIADDFADFRSAKIKATSIPARIVQFFRDILNFFKSIVSKPSLKDELFNAIEAGKFREYTVSSEVVADTEARYSRIPGVTETQANEFVQDMSIVISSFVFNPNLSDKSALYNIKDITGDQVYNHVKDLYTSYGWFEELGQERFDQLYQRATDYMRTLGVDIAVDEQVSINDESTNKNDYAPEPFATDWKKASRFAVKFSLATLPESTNQVDENGVPVLKESSISGYVLSNFSKTFANLLDKLSNTTLAKLDNKLISLMKADGNYTRVFTRLGGDLTSQTIPFDDFTKSDWRFFIQFYQTFTKQKPDAVVQFISGDGSTYSAQADQFSESKKLVRDWFENFKIASRSKDTLLKFNRDKKEYYVDTESEKFPKRAPSTPSQMVEFLESLGINFPMDDYLALSEQKTQGQKISDRNRFADNVSSLYKFISKDESFYSIDGKTLGVSGPLNSLANLYITSTTPNQDNTLLNVEGKRVQKYADNNYTSVFENEFNEASTLDEFLASRPELRDVYSQNSIILQRGGKFFNEDGDRTGQIKISTIQGTYNDNDRSGTSTANLTKGKRFTQEINQNLNGNYYILIPADSSTEWMINLGTQGNFAFTNTEAGWQGVYDIFNGYLKDEVALALDYENRQALQHVKSKAKQLRMFKDILPADIVERIHLMINDGSTQAEIESYVSNNQDNVNESIKEMLLSEVTSSKNQLIQNGEVVNVPTKRDAESVFKYENLDSDFINSNNLNKNNLTEEQLDNVLLFANINYAIANIEMHKILFGDPYQFKIKDGKLDETKRIKSFLSPRRTTFDSVEYNNFLNENYNDAQGIPLDPEDMFAHEFKSYVSTVTLGDVELITPLFQNVNETDGFSILSLPAYREIKLKNGEWPDEAEDFFQWDNSYTRQKLSKKGKYTYTNPKLETADKEAIAKRKPDFKSEVLKPIVSGVKHNQGRLEIVLDKFSQMPISYQAVEGTALEELYIKMLTEKKGYVIFESGRKVGTRSMSSLYNSDGSFNTEPFNPASIENVSWKSYGIQVENAYEDKDQTRGSQLTKLSSLDMFDNGEEVIPGARKEYERNVNLLDQMHNNSYKVLLEKLGVEDLGDSYKLIDPTKVSETLQYELLRREASENMKDTLRLDESGEFRIPFESSPAYKQIKDILYSMVHKALISPTMSGKPHVQVPVTLWENAKEGRGLVRKIGKEWVKITRSQYNALSEEDKKGVRLTSDTLKFYEDEDGKRYCEIMLPHWFKDKLDRKKYPNDEAILKYLNNTKEGQKILSGIGFRIPTQATSSVEVFRVKKFLDPSMGSTVVVPSEITSKAGSDFDIDKLNMYLKSIYIDKDGNIRLIEYKGSEQATKDFYRGVYEETIQKELERITKYDDFRDRLIDVFDTLESIENPEEMTGEGLEFLLGEDLSEFYDYHHSLIQEIIEQATNEGVTPSDYIGNQIGRAADKYEKLSKELLNEKVKKDYVDRIYKKALENEYYDSLEKLISLPGNFQRLVNPIGNAGLDKIAAELDAIKGEKESDIKNKIISRSFMTSLRHAFVLGKKWVGIAAVNITGHSLTQKSKVVIDPEKFANLSDYDRKYLGDGSTFLPHNSIDRKISLSGVRTADGSEYISDRLSGYATGFVDVAKDPYIMKIVQSDLTVGIAMFMERIGVGETTAWFLQQPIVSQYITYLEANKSTSLFNKDNIANIEALYPTEEDISDIEVDPSQLISNIEKYYSGETISDMDNAIQRRIFQEFLKMAKMSQYSFSFSQAYNYDTTKFRDSDAFEKKMVRTDITRDENIITSIDNVLDSSFIGEQKTFIEKAINSMGAIIKTELEEFKKYTQDVIRPYQENQYLSADKFEQISARLKSSFLDFIIFTKNPKFQDVYSTLLTGDNSTASKLPAIQEKYPNMKLLQDLRIESSQREGGAATIKLAVQARDAYDQNLYTEMMRELRDLEPRFYKELVTISVLQGNFNSPISIKSIIPIEDYSKIIKPIIDSLQPHASLDQFANDSLFFRNNWRNEDIVPTAKNIRMFFPYQQGMQMDMPVGEDRVGNEIYQYVSMMFPVIKGIQDKPSSRQILTLNPIYDRGNHINNDFIKVPKIFERRVSGVPTGEFVNLFTGRTFTSYQRAQALKKGDLSIYDYVGYKKVKYSNGEPVLTAKGEHIYKMVNLYGDGQYAIEYPVSLGPSVFNNGSVKVEQEIPDAEIIKYYGGEPGSQETISSSRIPVTTSSVNLSSAPVVNKTINVYWGQAESETSTRILSNLAERRFIYEGREYGSVEHAYQTLKSGNFAQGTYDAYNKIGGFGKKIRGLFNPNSSFDNLELMKELVVESFKQNPNSEAANKLRQYDKFTHNTNEIIDKAFLEGLSLARKALFSSSSLTEREYTPENITSLKPNEVFVFGANTVGGHGGGTAGLAQRGTTSSNYTSLPTGTKGKWSEYGIVDKLMQGTEGKSFGIVTKSATINGNSLKIGSKRSVPLSRIEESINALIKTANDNPDLKFLVTKFGTNMAGFSEQEMKSLLQDKNIPNNIILPREYEVRGMVGFTPPTSSSSSIEGGSEIFISAENVKKASKKTPYKITLTNGETVEKTGYKITFTNYPDVQFYATNVDGTWQIDEVTTSKSIGFTKGKLSDLIDGLPDYLNSMIKKGNVTIFKSIGFTTDSITGEFATLSDFPIEQKETILKNFASKYKMDRQKALNYINEALLTKDREAIIEKLKDCY